MRLNVPLTHKIEQMQPVFCDLDTRVMFIVKVKQPYKYSD